MGAGEHYERRKEGNETNERIEERHEDESHTEPEENELASHRDPETRTDQLPFHSNRSSPMCVCLPLFSGKKESNAREEEKGEHERKKEQTLPSSRVRVNEFQLLLLPFPLHPDFFEGKSHKCDPINNNRTAV